MWFVGVQLFIYSFIILLISVRSVIMPFPTFIYNFRNLCLLSLFFLVFLAKGLSTLLTLLCLKSQFLHFLKDSLEFCHIQNSWLTELLLLLLLLSTLNMSSHGLLASVVSKENSLLILLKILCNFDHNVLVWISWSNICLAFIELSKLESVLCLSGAVHFSSFFSLSSPQTG